MTGVCRPVEAVPGPGRIHRRAAVPRQPQRGWRPAVLRRRPPLLAGLLRPDWGRPRHPPAPPRPCHPVTPGCPSKPCAAACSRGPVRGAHLFRSLRADLCSSFRRIRRHVPAAPRGPVRQRNSFRVLHPALCQLGRAVLVSAGELRVASAAWQHAAGTPAGRRDGCCWTVAGPAGGAEARFRCTQARASGRRLARLAVTGFAASRPRNYPAGRLSARRRVGRLQDPDSHLHALFEA
jgi:hypothetical protein